MTSVTPESAGWRYSGLRVLDLDGAVTFETGEDEVLVVPLSGSCTVECDGEVFTLDGREDVFAGVTDFAYAPRDAAVTVTGQGRFAVPTARASRRLPPRYGPAAGVPVELRGAGSCSRQVNNFCTPGVFEADRLIACEVLTPGGNWSSYPPHKHDEDRPGESVLEEIYYFEVRGSGMAYQRVYGPDVDVLAEVRGGDVVLIPRGWHGPSMAAPGYDLYYLNVMAGPRRAWEICDDPAHAWIRDTWASQAVDPRLPFRSGVTT
ncbi:5-deoxy-glucuronate isomerase [Phytohabitans houttuyneae]|uniref:5-deoxy-glucuronate isomerase n=1 Tax=Phytohabitans houttuyneae TaxID=1076126 RepID=A0A6V8K3K6_9ACTN|nr:5-deoxy-glucuronate isomerase [Phytohabitans houttuyneae]GFJ76749.1 5-deoxy-glucuronate isomerase [Phytohabitans houttuyneae]